MNRMEWTNKGRMLDEAMQLFADWRCAGYDQG